MANNMRRWPKSDVLGAGHIRQRWGVISLGVCKSTPEVLQDCVDTFGADLGPVYDALYNEVLWLHAKWLEYRKLYESPERVALLNATAPFFFAVAQDTLWHDVLLHITRLTDPAKTGRHQNLSLRRLADMTPGKCDTAAVDEAYEQAAFARKYRDKHLAHSDLELSLHAVAEPLSQGNREAIEGILASFATVLNGVASAYGRHGTPFRDLASTPGDGRSLLFHLALSQLVTSGREQRALNGEYRDGDYEQPVMPV